MQLKEVLINISKYKLLRLFQLGSFLFRNFNFLKQISDFHLQSSFYMMNYRLGEGRSTYRSDLNKYISRNKSNSEC